MQLMTLSILFFLAVVLIVPISHRLKLGAVLGYLVAGIIIGPFGLKLVSDTESILHFSELGVIFLMFTIGLELQPSRLWVLRRSVFGLGALQVILTTAAVTGVALFFSVPWQVAVLLGIGLSMSSTALVLQSLAERDQLTSRHGRDSFSVLLFQDLAVIPVLALLPALATGASENSDNFTWQKIALPLVLILAFVFLGRIILKPAFKWVAKIENREIFTAAALLIVLGTAVVMNNVGLSMGLGAFLAGVLLSDSEYRHELESDIAPFKGLLLGLFFVSIGMTAKIDLLMNEPLKIMLLVFGLYFIKGGILFLMKLVSGEKKAPARKLSIYLSQGGEFAFVVFAAAVSLKIMDPQTSDLFVMVVTVSMLLAPVLFVLEDQVFSRKMDKPDEPEYDKNFEESPVIIAGFGRFGQIVGRMLSIRKIPFTALDKSASHVDFVRKFGNKIFYGDASRLDLLLAAKAGSAKLIILAIDNVDESIKTAELIRRHFPNVPVFARARNRFHVYKLLDLGIEVISRETLASSLEMAQKAIAHLGVPENQSKKLVEKFRNYDEELLKKQYAVYQNEVDLVETSKQARADLESLFENDNREIDNLIKENQT